MDRFRYLSNITTKRAITTKLLYKIVVGHFRMCFLLYPINQKVVQVQYFGQHLAADGFC